MANARQRSVTQYQSQYLGRSTPQWYVPSLSADKWRSTIKQVPLAGLCMRHLIGYIRGLQWSISTAEAADVKDYKSDIDYYTQILDGGIEGAPSQPFDNWIDTTVQDTLTLPVGGNVEAVRYSPGKVKLPKPYNLKGEHPRGHVHKVVFMDGATLAATGDDAIPLLQRPPAMSNPIYLPSSAVGRMVNSPRPELQYKGWGVAPPEWIYLALLMLWRGDIYYYQLLTDTPEAGILYLGDVDPEDVTDWLSGFRSVFSSESTMKMPVWYGPTKPEVTQFNRPPAEMSFTEATLKYARLVTAAYGLKLSDIGIEAGTDTLAGKIRDQAATRITGYGVMQTMIENMINFNILPPYLKFSFKIVDPEAMIQTARARLMSFQWAKAAKESEVLSTEEIREQIAQDGIITIKLSSKPPEPAEAPPEGDGGSAAPKLPSEARGPDKQIQNEMDKVSPESGGEGELLQPKSLVSPRMFGVNKSETRETDSGILIVESPRTIKAKSQTDGTQIDPQPNDAIASIVTCLSTVISNLDEGTIDNYDPIVLKSDAVNILAKELDIEGEDDGMEMVKELVLGIADTIADVVKSGEAVDIDAIVANIADTLT